MTVAVGSGDTIGDTSNGDTSYGDTCGSCGCGSCGCGSCGSCAAIRVIAGVNEGRVSVRLQCRRSRRGLIPDGSHSSLERAGPRILRGAPPWLRSVRLPSGVRVDFFIRIAPVDIVSGGYYATITAGPLPTRLLGGADLQGFVTHRLAIARVAARLVARVARAYGARHLGSSTWASRCGVVQLSSAKSMMQKVV